MSMESRHSDGSRDPDTERGSRHDDDDHGRPMKGMYLRFAAMILTAMVVMYWVMFVGSWEWSHIRFSQSRVFMAVTMGGTMGLIMLAWMLNMYKNTKANLAIVVVSILLLAAARPWTGLRRRSTTRRS